MNRLKAFWASLPSPVQAVLVAFSAAFFESLTHALSEGGMTFSKATVLHLLKGAIVAGVVAARAFYMLPNRGTPSQTPPPNIPARIAELPPLNPTQPA